MSSPIWTPDALSSEAQPLTGAFWRLVEAQHQVSTMKLTDTSSEQARLETLLEDTKPTLPADAQVLDYLLATPFRYGALYPQGSRFRRAGRTLGVFYAAVRETTAVAEMAFYRLLFFRESPATPLSANPSDYTAFAAKISTPRAINLTRPPLSRDRAAWEHPTEYGACQALADAARSASIEAILYRSVRDPEGGTNLALLSPAGFAQNKPVARRSWRIHFSAEHVQALSDFPRRRLGFALTDFTSDPRIAERIAPIGSPQDPP
ncbi:RES family NAD+ phosphorylase [Affinirhizobium pseudoryzae]|uniref:RES family NAD+ phosphorylase n=1 Tax=Allorhizobium pseudoryzae TaxID=379684 RepID=UPI0013EA5E54|nr:RES family NAD+ phosphorylase [Allorhizobium pseudoryzae]